MKESRIQRPALAVHLFRLCFLPEHKPAAAYLTLTVLPMVFFNYPYFNFPLSITCFPTLITACYLFFFPSICYLLLNFISSVFPFSCFSYAPPGLGASPRSARCLQRERNSVAQRRRTRFATSGGRGDVSDKDEPVGFGWELDTPPKSRSG